MKVSKFLSLKRLLLMTAIVFSAVSHVMAGGGGTTYYAKITAQVSPNQTGVGLVYVGRNSDTPADDDYKSPSYTEGNGANGTNNGSNVQFHLWAKAEKGWKFDGWKVNESATSFESTDNTDWSVTVRATSTNENNPTNGGTRYAVFSLDPEIEVNPASLIFESNYPNESGAQSFQVTGYPTSENLALHLSLSGTAFEMMITEGYWTNELNVTRSAQIFVRMKGGLPGGDYNGSITVSSTVADSQTVNLSGHVTGPSLDANPGSLSDITSILGFADQQTPRSFTVSGENLGSTDVTVTAPTNFVVSLSEDSDYGNTVSLTPVSGTVNSTIYVKLVDGLGEGNYNGDISLAWNDGSLQLSEQVSVSGTVVGSLFRMTPTALTNMGYMTGENPGRAQQVHLEAYNISNNVVLSITDANKQGFEFATSEDGPYETSLTLPVTDNYVDQVIYVRLNAVDEYTYTANLHAFSGSKSCDVALEGTVEKSQTGVYEDKVVLNDFEDHTWTYYAGVDASVDGGNYNTNYVGKIYSPNPRNVKITYTANGGAVSISENQNVFIYYETLEESATEDEYDYQVISNPFSKRPTGKGFGGWKIISGGDFIKNHNNNDVLNLDEEIVFENLPYPSVNCTSAEIELKATWVDANVTYITSNPGSGQTYSFTGGTYETNFIVLKKVNYSRAMTINSPCTIMMVEPDGSVDYRNSYTFTGNITPADLHDTGKTTKIEYATWNPNGEIDARGRNFTIGRGMTMGGTARRLYGTNTEAAVNQVVKIESGKLSSFYHYGAKPSSITQQIVVFGNDYDRANKNDNTKLDITGICKISNRLDFGLTDSKTMLCRTYSKSGKIMSSIAVGAGETDNVYYYAPDGSDNNYHGGCRYLEIQGGEWCCIAGGFDNYHASDDPAFTFRMKGGLVRGSVYGAGEFYGASGNRFYVLTGGQIKGWLAAGANGTRSDGGETIGTSFVYVGGNAKIDSEGSTTLINKAVGGNVFGAGCGNSSTSSSGEMTKGTNVVVADNAYVERGVYGGGGYGFTKATSNIYVTGGTVAGVYQNAIPGGVFGGAQQNKGGSANIYMTDGKIEKGGLFGGSNSSGTLSDNVTMHIEGGQVGTAATPASVYGGGYGQSTVVSGTVNIDVKGTPVITGNLYGGSYAGKVQGSVNITVGEPSSAAQPQINNIYGAGYGAQSDVAQDVTVTLNQGKILGSVYGGGEHGTVNTSTTATTANKKVVVNIAGGEVRGFVFGGGDNGACYATTTVNMTGGKVYESVFAGAKGSSKTILVSGLRTFNMQGGEVYGSVYGGSRNSNDGDQIITDTTISMPTTKPYLSFVNISGGTIHQHVYGGGFYGYLYGSSDVNIGKQAIEKANAENDKKLAALNTNTPIDIQGSVYAGSNWGDFTGEGFTTNTTLGHANIYVDGTDYDNSLSSDGHLQNNYINIATSLYGAGTSCYAGKLGHDIYVKNYGQRVTGTESDGTQIVTGATRSLYSIQNAGRLLLDNSSVKFLTEGDMTSSTNTVKYAVVNVEAEMVMADSSAIVANGPIDYVKSLKSVKITNGDAYAAPVWEAVNLTTVTGSDGNHSAFIGGIENVIRMNSGHSINVRYLNDDKELIYGELGGFFRVSADKSSKSFAYARPKYPNNNNNENGADGGFLCYHDEHNNYNNLGTNSLTDLNQYPYENILLAKDDRPDYRQWNIGMYNDDVHSTVPAAVTAMSNPDQANGFTVVPFSVELHNFDKNICDCENVSRVEWHVRTVSYGDHATLVDAAYLNGTQSNGYMYYDKQNNRFETTTDAETVAAEMAKITAHPNTTFGLTMATGGSFAANQPTNIICPDANGYYSTYTTTYPNETQKPVLQFYLTHSNDITVNAPLSPVTLEIEHIVVCEDENGNDVSYPVDVVTVPITITTQTQLGQDVKVDVYALFGAVGTGDVHQSYRVMAAIPPFQKPADADAYCFKVTRVSYNGNISGQNGPSQNIRDIDPMPETDRKYAMVYRQSLNNDGKNGWLQSESVFNEQHDATEVTPLLIGTSDGRMQSSVGFTLYYNSTQNDIENPMNDGKVGEFTYTVTYYKYSELTGVGAEAGQFNIIVTVKKKTAAKAYYLDGIAGSNNNDGSHPDQAKYSLQGIFDTEYSPADYIIVVQPVTAQSLSTVLSWSNAAYGSPVNLYRYSGNHTLYHDGDPNFAYALEPNNGPLVIVKSEMEMTGIVLNGMNEWSGNIHSELNPTGESIAATAPLVQVIRGEGNETGGSLTLRNSVLRDNYNTSITGAPGSILGGGAYVDPYSTLILEDGSSVADNMLKVQGSSAPTGAGIYLDAVIDELGDSEYYATMEVYGKVKADSNGLTTNGTTVGTPNNVYLKEVNNYITVDKNKVPAGQPIVDEETSIGITTDAFHADGALKDLTPVVVCKDGDEIDRIFARHGNFYDDKDVYYQYHNNESPYGENVIYFGRTWAAVVTSAPEDFAAAEIDTPEELAWAISIVNGLNGQEPSEDAEFKVTGDLDMSAHVWMPIGSEAHPYAGKFDGNGHTIDGIMMQHLYGRGAYGLFGYVDGGTIEETFVTSGVMAPVSSASGNKEYIGGLVGSLTGGSIATSEAALTMTADNENFVMGGLVGKADNTTIHSSMAMPTMTGYEMGGLVGELTSTANLFNSFSNVKFESTDNNNYVGGLAAVNNGTIENCYPRFRGTVPTVNSFGQFVGDNTGSNVSYCYAPEGSRFIAAPETSKMFGVYSETSTPYMYKHADNDIDMSNASEGEDIYYNYNTAKNGANWPIMLRTLNAWVDVHSGNGYEHWMRTTADGLNNDYPIHKIAAFNTVASLDAVVLEYKPDFYKMIDKYNHITGGGTIDLYANQADTLSAFGENDVVLDNNDDVILYINEDVALLQPDEQTLRNVYVGITLDNSAGEDGADSGHPLFSVEDAIDWHMFSTPLHDAPLGINYTDTEVHNFSYDATTNPDYYFFPEVSTGATGEVVKDGYFPSHTYGKTSSDAEYNYNADWDFYTFEEKYHHWMNFKRNKNSHWDEDPATGHANLEYNNTNESTLVPGKGYLLAIANETFLQSHGTLNSGEVKYESATSTSNPFTMGYNLIGNPYQSYLDFSKFVEKNTTIDSYVILDEDAQGYVTVAAGGSRNTLPEGYVAPGNMIHMHQGFFIHVDEITEITFDNTMRSADKDSEPSFRGARRDYPLVNLVVKEENGNREYLTVETNRPSIGGAKKMKGLRAGSSQMFAHAGNADYAILFATEDMNEVPVRFSTEADATYTMIWNTQNGEFTKLQLIDNIAGVTVDMLSSDEYTFTSKATDYESRFRLVFRAIGDDEDDDESETEDGDFAFFDGSSLVVSGTGILSVCDVNGRVLYCTDVNGTQSSVSMPDMARGLYLLRLTSSESTKVQKIVIRK